MGKPSAVEYNPESKKIKTIDATEDRKLVGSPTLIYVQVRGGGCGSIYQCKSPIVSLIMSSRSGLD
jgi:hypothetical protein